MKRDIKKLIGHFESMSNDSDQGYTSAISDYSSDDDQDDREITAKKLDFSTTNHYPSEEGLSVKEIPDKINLTEKCDKLLIEIERLNREYNVMKRHTEVL